MRLAGFLMLLSIFAALAGHATADGKFYVAERVPEVPFQRAVIWHDGAREIMVVQSKYDLKSANNLKEVGWVLPLPSIPDVGTMRAEDAAWLFYALEHDARPEIIGVGFPILAVLVGLVWLRILMFIIASIAGYKGRYRKYLGGGWGNLGLFVLMLYITFNMGIKAFGIVSGTSPVEVVRESIAGVYEIKVVKSDSAAELVNWLKERDFRFEAEDERVFADYIKRGWSFATARIAKGRLADTAALDAQSLVNPLVLRFDTKEAVYPLALTATAAQPTEILLYSYSAHKADSGGRLPLEFASPVRSSVAEFLASRVEPTGLFKTERFPEFYLTQFRGRLTAEQMHADLVLKRSSDDTPYRKRNYGWIGDWGGALAPPPMRADPELLNAAAAGDLARVQSLLGEGSPDDVRNAFQETALHVAARAGKIDVAAYLISRGSDVNARANNGATPLEEGASAGQKAVVELLLDNGASIDLGLETITPLCSTIMSGHDEVAKLLIEKGADIGRGALIAAAGHGRVEIAKLLIARGDNVNGYQRGRLPLALAVQNDDLEMVQLLVEHGADVNGKDIDSPLRLARSAKVQNYLIANGAR